MLPRSSHNVVIRRTTARPHPDRAQIARRGGADRACEEPARGHHGGEQREHRAAGQHAHRESIPHVEVQIDGMDRPPLDQPVQKRQALLAVGSFDDRRHDELREDQPQGAGDHRE